MKNLRLMRGVIGCAIGVAAVGALFVAQRPTRAVAAGTGSGRDRVTKTPIKHVILIIGENRTFDHLFGTFVPKRGQQVWNLLSQKIVNADGTPGPNFARAAQWQARDEGAFSIRPPKTGPYTTLPRINTDGTPVKPPFATVAAAAAVEPALLPGDEKLLTTGGSALPPGRMVDPRFPALPNGPFAITRYISEDDYASSPVHRFYQMWQQLDCDVAAATSQNPSGCRNDLFPWVEVTIGAGNNGRPQPAGFNDQTTGEGATAMGFYNALAGDGSYFTELASEFALNDNFHQSIQGGTGANHLALGYGQTIFYADANGKPATPPANQIENPTPRPGTNNWYTQDGYGGGSYVNCADDQQPGVDSLMAYLRSLPYRVFRSGDCVKGGYYLVNNYNPGYLGNGQPAPLGPDVFTIPPTRQRNIGLLLSEHDVSWKYYGEGWDGGTENGEDTSYCNICNPFLYSTQIMTNPNLRKNLQDIQDLYRDIQDGTLPAVSIVKPDGFLDGHPASSKWNLFEGFTKKIIEMVQANGALWDETAIMITVDEGGGYWDSGYIQPLDFFGDGTRIPLIVVSPFSKGVGMVHSYGDHVSFDKFVEANWGLETIAPSGRDNLPNPIVGEDNPYVPKNSPAIGDLMDMFTFGHRSEED
ncbi:MAG TPA: alkaline phosphatase family protein [Gemmatimonadales bacterium]|nr:alkaline phosphatase family protein [Gemmatimonadales bacterium]